MQFVKGEKVAQLQLHYSINFPRLIFVLSRSLSDVKRNESFKNKLVLCKIPNSSVSDELSNEFIALLFLVFHTENGAQFGHLFSFSC